MAKSRNSRSWKIAEKTIFAALQILKENDGQLQGRQVIDLVGQRVELDEYERARYEKSGYIRWQSILHFYTIDCIKAGFLIKKKGLWYLTPEGDFVIQVRVRQDIFEADNLEEFNRFADSLADDYFGMPMVVQQLEGYMKRDFFLSTAIAAVVIILLLRASLRGWVRALLAGAPLVLGYVWMLGGMRLLSMDFNFLSITISPLLIGIGVDNGIHILHRTVEERCVKPEGAIERGVGTTAVAVIVTTMTTMLVFGSLMMARTPGLRILGASALLGIGFALLFSLLFLPAALRVEGGKRV